MKVNVIASLFLCLGTLFCTAGPKEYTKGVVATPVLITGTTANGAPIAYPKTEAPEIKVLTVDIPPGAETGWHRHPSPCVAYILSGAVTVELENGKQYTAHAGEAFAEVVNTLHNGHNYGAEPVRIIMTVIGQKGVPVTER